MKTRMSRRRSVVAEEELKTFPSHKVRARSAVLGARLTYNPYSKLQPTIWHAIEIELEPIDLGDDAYAPDIFGETLETSVRLGGIALAERSWTSIAGEQGPVEDTGSSSMYVSNVHVPVDIVSLVFDRLQGKRFAIHVELWLDFEYAGAGYRNTLLALDMEADYDGVSFRVPQWNEPDKVKFPEDWRIPTAFNERTVAELFGRFVDLGGYRLTHDAATYRLLPDTDR
jgi:hypothetical protein